MALTHKVGNYVGNAGSSIRVPISVWDNTHVTIDTATAISYALSIAPTSVFGLLPVSDDPAIEEVNGYVVRVEIEYTPADVTPPVAPPVPETGTMVRRASFQAKGKHVLNAIEPIGAFDDGGDVTDDYEDDLWSVNVQGKGFEQSRVIGLDVEPLPESFTLDYYAPNTTITKAYLDSLAALCGKFNDAEWNDYPQGSLQIVRVNLSERTPDDWELSFGFGYAPPQTDLQIGPDITIPELRGSWIYWTKQKEVYDETRNIIHVVSYLAFVQRVWDEDDFDILDLPAMG